ncbi:MAG: PDZ domain-containing protein [Xanthomonadales bacterium]|nr:PDZ domain-containing protein [Xanthomonadales bacterium]
MTEARGTSSRDAGGWLLRGAAVLVFAWAVLALFEASGKPWAGYEANHRHVVLRVAPGSPAERAGLRPGDQLVTIDGRRTDDPAALASLARSTVGQTRSMTVVREAETVNLALAYEPAPIGLRLKAWAAIIAGLTIVAICLHAWRAADSALTRWLVAAGIGAAIAFLPGPWFDSAALRAVFSLLRSGLVLLGLLGAWRFVVLLASGPRPLSHGAVLPVALLWLLLAYRTLWPGQVAPALEIVVLVCVGLVFGGYLLATTILFLRRYIQAPRGTRARSGLRLVLWGSVVGIAPGMLGSFTLLGQWPPATWFFLTAPLAAWAWARAARHSEASGSA